MQIEKLTKIALFLSIISLFVLYIISNNISIEEKNIAKINHKNIEEQIKIVGKINRITELEEVYFLELEQTSKITVVVFKDEKIFLNKEDYVEIEGKIDEYNGNIQIIANKITAR